MANEWRMESSVWRTGHVFTFLASFSVFEDCLGFLATAYHGNGNLRGSKHGQANDTAPALNRKKKKKNELILIDRDRCADASSSD